jgi:hypothetical protein
VLPIGAGEWESAGAEMSALTGLHAIPEQNLLNACHAESGYIFGYHFSVDLLSMRVLCGQDNTAATSKVDPPESVPHAITPQDHLITI